MKKIVFTITEDMHGDLDAKIVSHGFELIEALEIIKDAQEEMYIDRIKLN